MEFSERNDKQMEVSWILLENQQWQKSLVVADPHMQMIKNKAPGWARDQNRGTFGKSNWEQKGSDWGRGSSFSPVSVPWLWKAL